MGKNLIVFCPGYTGMPPTKYNPLLKRFSNEGFDIISVNYRYFGRGSISDTAKRVVKIISPIRDNYEHITLIGHSMGGLVARKALSIDPTLGDSLITLGTPHNGIQAAITPFWWLGGKAVGHMKRTSKFLKYLSYPNLPILAVNGKYDLIIKDASLGEHHSAGEGAKNIELPSTHLGLILSNRVFGEIYSWLQYEILDTLPKHKESGKVNGI